MKPIAVFLAAVALSSSVMADDLSNVTELTKKTTEAIITLLTDESLTEAQCKAKVRSELLMAADFALTAMLTLGRKYWPRLNAEQRKEFQGLFIDQLVDTYFDKAKRFANEKVVYSEAAKVKNKIHISISFTARGDKIEIKNKFYRSKTGWRIYDMEIQDVSIVRSYGSQYAEILRDGTVEDLLKKMREKTVKLQESK